MSHSGHTSGPHMTPPWQQLGAVMRAAIRTANSRADDVQPSPSGRPGGELIAGVVSQRPHRTAPHRPVRSLITWTDLDCEMALAIMTRPRRSAAAENDNSRLSFDARFSHNSCTTVYLRLSSSFIYRCSSAVFFLVDFLLSTIGSRMWHCGRR